jgi:bacteriorhodopsin
MYPMSLLHSSLLFSIVVQAVTGVIELLALFVKTAPGMALIRQLLGLELAVQAVEGAFYVWLYYNINAVKNITPKRYVDWAITTPTMLVTLVAYIIYLNSDKEHTESLSLIQILREYAVPIAQIVGLNWLMLLFGYLGEVGVIPLITGVTLGFAPFIAYFYIIYERFVANDANNGNNGNNGNNDNTSLKIYAYFLVFWSLYGIVAVLPYTLKNTIYNVLDLFSKNFFGVFLSYLIVSNAISS